MDCGQDVMKHRRIHEPPWLACQRASCRYSAQMNRHRVDLSVVDEGRAGCPYQISPDASLLQAY